jgi:uncharacterized membrane protein YbhN (UPF0104 family)
VEVGWASDHLERPDKLAALVVAAAALAAAAIFGLGWVAGWTAMWHRLEHADWQWVPIAVAGEVVAYVGYIVAYREVARVEGGAELRLPHLAALVATGFGVFVAAGGFALDREALERAGLDGREARRRVLGLGALEYAVLGPAAAIAGGIILARGGKAGPSLTLPWLIGVPVGFALAFWLLRFRGGWERRGGWRGWLATALESVDCLRCLAIRPLRHGSAFVGCAVYWLGDVFCLWATLHAFDSKAPVTALILGYATGYALTRRTLPLGGAGVVEALLPFALGWVGIPLAPAVLAVVSYRLVNLWLPMLPALAGLPALRRTGEGAADRRVLQNRSAARLDVRH